jgi:hypothetical protein
LPKREPAFVKIQDLDHVPPLATKDEKIRPLQYAHLGSLYDLGQPIDRLAPVYRIAVEKDSLEITDGSHRSLRPGSTARWRIKSASHFASGSPEPRTALSAAMTCTGMNAECLSTAASADTVPHFFRQ